MDTNKDLLDTPLEEIGTLTNGSLRYTSVGILKLDFGISAVLIVLSLLAGIVALFDAGMIMVVMICTFFLGCYQLLSGLIGSIRGNRKKLIYFVAALVYLAVLSGVYMYGNAVFGESFEIILAITGLVLIPMAFALYYTKLCYDVLKEQ